MRPSTLCFALPLLSVATVAAASEPSECQIRILRPVTDDMGNHWKVGQLLPTTSIQRGKNGVAFCAHGGSCVPRMANGGQAAQLVHCHPGRTGDNGSLEVVPDAQMMNVGTRGQMITRAAAEQKLSSMGLSNVSSGSFAGSYVSAPNSPDGRLVAQALAGSRVAQAALKKRDGQ